jgi:hypothetical protein
MNRQQWIAAPLCIAVVAGLALAGPASADPDRRSMRAFLNGYSEVPAVSSTGRGVLIVRIAEDESAIEYTLSYRDLEGVITTAAHIHFGQPGVAGGVSAFVCGGGTTPACPAVEGTVSGTILAADVVGPAGQGIAAGELDELIAAMRRRFTYVNVHTDKHPTGEIRGAIR